MLAEMFARQKTGSVVCSSCGSLVGVNDDRCYSCGRRNPGLWGFGPMLRRFGNDLGFVNLVVYGCSILYALTLIGTVALGDSVVSPGNMMNFLAPSTVVTLAFGASGAEPIFRFGMWWSVLSAGWLHGSALHILFNMLWVRQLGPATADVYGAGRMVIIYTLSSITGFALSTALYMLPIHVPFFGGAGLTVGASAPIFGLLGALVYYGRRTGASHIGQAGLQYALIAGVMGFILPGVDNSAHLGGFIGGYLASMILDPLKSERIDHLAIAVGCLVVTLLAVIWSVITAFPQLT